MEKQKIESRNLKWEIGIRNREIHSIFEIGDDLLWASFSNAEIWKAENSPRGKFLEFRIRARFDSSELECLNILIFNDRHE